MEDRLVTIATYSSITDAYIYKNILDLSGVESIVDDSNAFFTPAVPDIHDGGVRLSVREGDAAKAISLLNEQSDLPSDPEGTGL